VTETKPTELCTAVRWAFSLGHQAQDEAMATFAETMLSKYETLLQTSAGLDSITVDGQSVRHTSPTGYYMAHACGA